MAIVGFNFLKISAERKPSNNQNINIESNASVTNVEELQSIDPKKTMLRIEFTFLCKYEPSVGKVEITGELLEIYDKDFGTKVLEYWAKEKKLYGEILQDVFNTMLTRSNVEAIIISRDLGLPSPIQMPRVDIQPTPKNDKREPKIVSKIAPKDELKKK